MLRVIDHQMRTCKLDVHPDKTNTLNLRCHSEKQYPRKYDFLGFSIRPVMREVKGGRRLLPGIFVINSSKKAIREKFKDLGIHKRRILIKELA